MKTLLVVINLITAILFFTLIYSAANIDITMPVEKGISYNLEGTDLLVSFPVSIRNNGIYPIEKLNIEICILNKTNRVFEHSFVIKKIEPFHIFSKLFSFKVNLVSLYKKLGDYSIFHGGSFDMNVRIHAKYWILADFNAFYHRAIEFNPIIYHYQIYYNEIGFKNGEIVVPYFISKLPVNLNATMGLSITDRRGIVAIGKEKIIFDRKAYMILKTIVDVNYLLTNSEVWTIKYTINLGGFAIERSTNYRWVAPISNIGLSEDMDKNITLYLQFKNNMNRDLDMEIDEVVIHNGEYTNKTMNITVKGGYFARVPLMAIEGGDYQIYVTIIEKSMNLRYTLCAQWGEENE